MTPRQLDELRSIPIGHALTIRKELHAVGEERAAALLERYEERIAIIAEGREPTQEEVSAAWASVLGMDDLMPTLPKRGEANC